MAAPRSIYSSNGGHENRHEHQATLFQRLIRWPSGFAAGGSDADAVAKVEATGRELRANYSWMFRRRHDEARTPLRPGDTLKGDIAHSPLGGDVRKRAGQVRGPHSQDDLDTDIRIPIVRHPRAIWCAVEIEFSHELAFAVDNLVGPDRDRIPRNTFCARVIDHLFILACREMLFVSTERGPTPGTDDVDVLSGRRKRSEHQDCKCSLKS